MQLKNDLFIGIPISRCLALATSKSSWGQYSNKTGIDNNV